MTTPHNQSRRALLAGLAIGAVAVHSLASAADAPRARLVDKAAAYRRARAEETAFDDRVYYPAIQALETAQAALPHEIVGVEPYTGLERSTADKDAVSRARSATSGRYWIDPKHPKAVAQYAFYERMKAAADRRDAKHWELQAASGIDALTDRSDALAEATEQAFKAVFSHIVASPAELALKMEIAQLRGVDELDGAWDTIMADARHLARRA